MTQRRFPPPWTVEDIGGCFAVKASNDRPLLFIYYGEGVGRRSLPRLLTRNAARTDRDRHRQATGATEKGVKLPTSMTGAISGSVMLRSRAAHSGGFIKPCLPSPAHRPPAGDGWLHEIKHDGIRILAHRDGTGVRLITRHGNDFTGRFPFAAAAVTALPARSFLIDGEAIVTNGDGLAVFDLIRHKRHGSAAVLIVFDLIELDGEDLRRSPIEYRKGKLAKLLRNPRPGIVLNEHYEGDGDIVFKHACKLGCEGIVSKRLGSLYRSGRSSHWLKVKNPKAPAGTREAEEDWGSSHWIKVKRPKSVGSEA